MVVIGVDPHKRMHVACVVEPATNRQVAALEFEASLAGLPPGVEMGGRLQ